jgi:hypothetical protein
MDWMELEQMQHSAANKTMMKQQNWYSRKRSIANRTTVKQERKPISLYQNEGGMAYSQLQWTVNYLQKNQGDLVQPYTTPSRYLKNCESYFHQEWNLKLVITIIAKKSGIYKTGNHVIMASFFSIKDSLVFQYIYSN